MQQLEKLGAVVYPPGKKDAVDWGLLAGAHKASSSSRGR